MDRFHTLERIIIQGCRFKAIHITNKFAVLLYSIGSTDIAINTKYMSTKATAIAFLLRSFVYQSQNRSIVAVFCISNCVLAQFCIYLHNNVFNLYMDTYYLYVRDETNDVVVYTQLYAVI